MNKRNRIISFAALLVFLFSIFNLNNIQADMPSKYLTFYANGFSDSDKTSINLTGNATFPTSQNYLSLTTATNGQAGGAFLNEKIKTTDGFSTFFEFKMSNQVSGGADGLVFIVAKNSNSLGEAGGGMGYGGIANSIGIEFDNYDNGEISNSHISINYNGVIPPFNPDTVDLGTGYLHSDTDNPFYAWVDYDATTKLMRVFISRTTTRPDSPAISKTIDIADYCGDEFHVGFTAATGGCSQNHIINKWYFSNEYISAGLTQTGDYAVDKTPPTTPTITNNNQTFTFASTDVGSGVDYYEYKIGSGFWVKDNNVDLSAQTFPFTLTARAIDKVGNISSVSTQTISAPDRTITFNSNGGSNVSTITGGNGSSISKPGDPVKTDYIFGGWYIDEALTQSISWPYTLNSNVTLYAKWTSDLKVILKEITNTIPNQDLISVTGNETAFPTHSVDLIIKENPGIMETLQNTLKEKVGDNIGNITIFPLDISFNIKGTSTKVQPADGTSVTITCPIPSNLLPNKDSIKVGCVVNNKFVLLDTKVVVVDGVYCIQFVAEHFSPYALVVDSKNLLNDSSYNIVAADSPETGDSIFSIMALAGISLSLVTVMIIFKNKKQLKNNY